MVDNDTTFLPESDPNIVDAVSELGVTDKQGTSFPVVKLSTLTFTVDAL